MYKKQLLKKKSFPRTFLLGLLLTTLVLSIIACGSIDLGESKDNEIKQDDSADNAIADSKKELFSVYYTDDQVMDIYEEKVEITYQSEKELLEKLWFALHSPHDPEHISLWEGVNINSILITEKQLIIDLSSSINVGASGEGIAIQCLLNTYKQLPTIETIQILINGKKVDTLAGHVTISEPFPKDEEIIPYKDK